jgi:dinuclear metal center YbgI/SA1388 family protein
LAEAAFRPVQREPLMLLPFGFASGAGFGSITRMAQVALSDVVRYCDRLLGTQRFGDWEGAANGLQVENRGAVTRLAAAVDGSLATVRMAVAAKADLLLVHHGLFWGPSHPWTGKRYLMLRELLDHDLAVYSSHLPLDAHLKLGNNALLCAAIGLKKLDPFFITKGQQIGLRSKTAVPREELRQRLAQAIGADPILIPGGPEICRHIGVVTGGAGDDLALAASEGIDTFVTGEGRHWTFALAEELGLNVLHGGHYATETFGVKALAAHLSKKFSLPWTFLDYPTGL